MVQQIVQLAAMPEINDYFTIEEALELPDVPYTAHWLRVLCQKGKVKSIKVGSKNKGQWLVNKNDLKRYIEEMDEVGTKKHGFRE